MQFILIAIVTILPSCLIAGQDFTIIGLPDTQYYTAGYLGGEPATFKAQTRWIVNNRDSLNIVFVVHLGDVVDLSILQSQWDNADEAMRVLEDPRTTGSSDGIPYGIAVGNHDMPTELYNSYFGVSRFQHRSWYGGHFGLTNDNHFALFSTSGLDFIVMFLEYEIEAGSPILSWADSILTEHSDRRAILVHHSAAIGDGAPQNDEGEIIYDALKNHPNFFLLLCGHWEDTEWRGERTEEGHTIFSLLADYQYRPHGGDGWLRIMQFSPGNNEIRVMTYSPTLDSFETDESSLFVLPYAMKSTSVDDDREILPGNSVLHQNYPNPFNSATAISYTLPVESTKYTVESRGSLNFEPYTLYVTLKVFNVLGQEVATLADEVKEPGCYTVIWDGKSTDGGQVASGIYLYRLRAGAYKACQKMIIMR